MTVDLHSAVRTAVDEARRLAQAATPGPWMSPGQDTVGEWSVYSVPRGWMVFSACVNSDPESRSPKLRDGITGDEANDNAAFIAAWDPSRALAMCDWADDVLARHRPEEFGSPALICRECSDGRPAEPWPCGDFKAAARAFAIEVEGAE